MRIDHNIPALQAWMSVKNTQSEMQTSIQRLSTGYRINSAADDAAGYAIVEKMMGQVSGLNTAIQNSQNAISAIQTASGAMNQTQSILQRMRELGVEASNDTNTTADRQQIQKEVNQLVGQIDQIRNTTQFNTQVLLNGNLNSVGDSGSATLVNPSNTITNAKIADGGKIESNTTITVATAKTTASVSNPDAVIVYSNGEKLDSSQVTDTSNGLNISVGGPTSAKLEAKAALDPTSVTITTGTNDAFNVAVDGTTNAITLAAGTYYANPTSGQQGYSALVSDIQSKIDTAFGTGKATVSLTSDNKIAITSATKGSTSEVEVTSGATDALPTLGFVSGQDIKGTGNVATAGSIAGTNTSDVTTLNDSSKYLNLTIDGINIGDVALTNVSGTSTTTSADIATDLKTDINTAIDTYNSANGTFISHVSVSANPGTGTTDPLTITSGTTGADSEVIVGTTQNGDANAAADLGLDQATTLKGDNASGSNLTVTLSGMDSANPTVIGSDYSGTYQVVDASAIRLDKATPKNNDMVFQVGANQSQTIQLGVNDMGAQALGLETTTAPTDTTKAANTNLGNGYYSTVDMTTKAGAQDAITLVDNAIQVVSTESAKLGAVQNRLTHITHNLQTASTNLTSAQSTIKDVDMAKEMMTFSKQQILLQSSMAMLAQANTNPQQVLRLFR